MQYNSSSNIKYSQLAIYYFSKDNHYNISHSRLTSLQNCVFAAFLVTYSSDVHLKKHRINTMLNSFHDSYNRPTLLFLSCFKDYDHTVFILTDFNYFRILVNYYFYILKFFFCISTCFLYYFIILVLSYINCYIYNLFFS